MLSERARRRWSDWWPFALLCVAAATRWMVSDAVPAAASSVASEAAGCGLAALVLFGFARLRQPETREDGRERESVGRLALAGAMLLCGPALALVVAVDPMALMMALALTPVVAGVAQIALGRGQAGGLAGRVWPGLAAIAGLLLVLPQPSLADVRGDIVLVLAPVLTGVGAALFCAGEGRAAARMVWGLSGAGLVFGLALLVELVLRSQPGFTALAAGMDCALALLAALALARVGTMRWTAQFTLVPLAILLEGIWWMRPRLDWRMLGGLGLVLVASVFLLLPQDDADEEEAGGLKLE